MTPINTSVLIATLAGRAHGSQSAIAEELGVTRAAVSFWVGTDWIPNPANKYLRLKYPGEHWEAYDLHLGGRTGPVEPSPAAA